MGKLSWYMNRLKAMSIGEVAWRMQQRRLQRGEMRTKYNSFPEYEETKGLTFCPGKIGIEEYDTIGGFTEIHLLGGYDYEQNKRAWHKDFGTGREWPRVCSYKLNYKGRDDIGDARINWELNRHYQFALLAKAYYVNGFGIYYDELRSLLDDWVKENPFLVGISWTSVMEIAIRLIQWTITREFLSRRQLPKGDEELLSTLDRGVLGMAGYVARHYSRYSSANNHLLVEATALAYAGYAYGYKPWQDLAVRLLDEQLERQNCSDGVNREMSLHYQAFGMEAYALTIHLMRENGREVPERWIEMMKKQCEFVSHSMVTMLTDEVVCEFGDNDEGKIIDLEGIHFVVGYIGYVLQLCSIITATRYDAFVYTDETIKWLFGQAPIDFIKGKRQYNKLRSRTFAEGGYSFLRRGDIFVGIDHAPLGFGSIAAHGHADALSFQLFKGDRPIFIDPGTYIYHCDERARNSFRSTMNHNTVTINGEEQSEMLGPFLWGKKAKTKLIESDIEGGKIMAETEGKNGVCHTRTYELENYYGGDRLIIFDHFSVECDWVATFILSPDVKNLSVKDIYIDMCSPTAAFRSRKQPNYQLSQYLPPDLIPTQIKDFLAGEEVFTIETEEGYISEIKTFMSPAYGQKKETTALRISGHGKSNMINIYIDVDKLREKKKREFRENLRKFDETFRRLSEGK